ncbi:cyclin-dependent kinase 14-like [Neolamprologus brichardi]|uniref:cyclin-dependent kinase 14-like n=1 Tax=Neolamprologus brichardi TaxID=32507 RepID=UPI0003EBDF83|nr:cyclin-dependent kinase 14-like [Neolamprologus brichardi]
MFYQRSLAPPLLLLIAGASPLVLSELWSAHAGAPDTSLGDRTHCKLQADAGSGQQYRFTVYSAKKLRQAWNKLGYVDHAEELASKFLQCFPKNRLSAQAALNHEYFSNLPPRLWELQDMSSIFTVPNVKLQTESGDSIQVCARRNSHGKASSGSKH